jgi:hypothetical protein
VKMFLEINDNVNSAVNMNEYKGVIYEKKIIPKKE